MKDIEYYLRLPYTVILRPDEEGDYVARIDELPGCVAHGNSPQEALESLEEAKRVWIADCLESGDPVPEPVSEEALPSGKWVQRVPRTLHKKLIEFAKREKVSLNQLVASILAEGVGLGKAERVEHATKDTPSHDLMDHRGYVLFMNWWSKKEVQKGFRNWIITERSASPLPLTATLNFLHRRIPNRVIPKLGVVQHAHEEASTRAKR